MAVESLKVLRRRVRSVRNIKQITRAMEMVAAAKLRRAQANLMAARPYAAKLQELLGRLSADEHLRQHPLFEEREGPRRILVLFTADRGLAGSFNTNLIKKAEDLLKSQSQTQWQLVTVGRKGHDYFRRRSWPIVESVIGLKGAADPIEARRVAESLVKRFLAGECDRVDLLYSRFISTVVYRPTLGQYLPLSAQALIEGRDERAQAGRRTASQPADYLFEPSVGRVIEMLLPRYLASRIHITMAEMATAEHSARMVAMNNATKNCTELGDQLTLKLNKARQAAITKELLEIVGGAEALKG
ncbi:MAG: ATP synthase F1 subunit gamma [bacterium]|nr:ATP synthase F1 subunit gamma [bacterium]